MTKNLEIWIGVEKLDDQENVIGCDCVLVVGKYTSEDRGSRDFYGQPMEPDYPAEIEILSATTEDGTEVELSSDDERQAMNKLWEEVAE